MKRIVLLGLLFTLNVYAEEKMDEAAAKAMQETNAMMLDPKMREAALAQDPNAKATAEQVKALAKGDPAKEAQLYKMASEAFTKMATEANGDDAKIQEMLEKAKTNPEAFGQNFTEEQKKLLRDLASEQKK
jgi:hypothetical protein